MIGCEATKSVLQRLAASTRPTRVGGSARHGFKKPQIARKQFRRRHDAHALVFHPLRNVCDHHLQELLHLLERPFGLEGGKASHREVRRALCEFRRVLGRIAFSHEHFFERGSRARGAGLPAYGPVALRLFGGVLHLENVLESPAHALAHDFVVRPELFGRDAQKRRRVDEIFPFARQELRLLIVHVLERMLDVSKPDVVIFQHLRHLGREHAFFAEARQHRERLLAAKPHVAAPADHLQRLRDEFDFPNAAASELHVRAREVSLRLAARRFGAKRLVEFRKRTDRAEVEVFAENEGTNEALDRVRSAFELLGTRKDGGAHHAALEPGEALPIAPLGVEVLFEHVARAHDRARVAVGAKPHVDAKDEARSPDVVQGGQNPPRESFVKFRNRERAPRVGKFRRWAGFAVFVVEEDEVDVGGDVEFAAAELAHADHDEVLGRSGNGAEGNAVAARKLTSVGAHRRPDGHFRKVRHALDHPEIIDRTRGIGRDEIENEFAPNLSERVGEALRIVFALDGALEIRPGSAFLDERRKVRETRVVLFHGIHRAQGAPHKVGVFEYAGKVETGHEGFRE